VTCAVRHWCAAGMQGVVRRVSRSRHRHRHGHMVMIALRLLVVVVAVDPRRGPPASNKCYYR
jgi:hypothetical protein